MIPSRLEPVTFQLVGQCLNQVPYCIPTALETNKHPIQQRLSGAIPLFPLICLNGKDSDFTFLYLLYMTYSTKYNNYQDQII